MTSPTWGRGICQKVTLLHKSLFSKMGDKGQGGVKNLKKWVTSFMDRPLLMFPKALYYFDYYIFSICRVYRLC